MNVTWQVGDGEPDWEPMDGVDDWYAREPGVFIANLAHYEGRDSGFSVEPELWRVNLAKKIGGELVMDTHEIEEPLSEGEGKQWAAEKVAEFLEAHRNAA